MTVGSDNPFPSILVVEQGSTPTTPASGNQRLFVDSADGLLKLVDDTGTVTPVGGGGGGASDLDALLALSGGQDISDALTGAAAPDAGNVFATMADVGGGGGVTLAYLGYNTVGGSAETMTGNRVYAKKITTSGACAIGGVELHIKETSDTVMSLQAMLFADVAGAIGDAIASGRAANLALTNTSGFASNYRWHGVPFGMVQLAASTSYWLGWQVVVASITGGTNATMSIHYDTSGSDRYYLATDAYIADGGRFSETDSTRKYSVRALTLG